MALDLELAHAITLPTLLVKSKSTYPIARLPGWFCLLMNNNPKDGKMIIFFITILPCIFK